MFIIQKLNLMEFWNSACKVFKLISSELIDLNGKLIEILMECKSRDCKLQSSLIGIFNF